MPADAKPTAPRAPHGPPPTDPFTGHPVVAMQPGQPISPTLCAVRGCAAAGMFMLGGLTIMSVIPAKTRASLGFGTRKPLYGMSLVLWPIFSWHFYDRNGSV